MSPPGDVYLEFLPHGKSVKVCAVCARTGLEVAVVGPVSAGQEQLTRVALRKLDYVRRRHQHGDHDKPPDRGGAGGVLV